jgi:hypothetical protein
MMGTPTKTLAAAATETSLPATPVRLLYTTQHLLSHPPHRSITRKQSTPQATHSQATSATHCWTQRRQTSSRSWHQTTGHPLPGNAQLAASLSRKWWCTVMCVGRLRQPMRPHCSWAKAFQYPTCPGTAATVANTMRWQRADQHCRPQGWQIALESSPHQRLPDLPARMLTPGRYLAWLAGHSLVQEYRHAAAPPSPKAGTQRLVQAIQAHASEGQHGPHPSAPWPRTDLRYH